MAIASPPLEYCGGGDWNYEETYYAIIDQRMLVDHRYDVYLNCPDSALCSENTGTETENIAAWKNYLGTNFSNEDVKKYIYDADLDFYKNLKQGVEASPLSRKLTRDKYSYFIDYMLLAKRAESSRSDQSNGNGWYQGENAPTVDNAAVLATAMGLFKTAPDIFMKHRVGFQAVRAAHYLQKNEQSVQLFRELFRKADADYMYYRAMEQAAGAAYNLKLTEAAIAGFITAFEQIPERRYVNGLNLKLAYDQLKNLGVDLGDTKYAESFYFYSSYFNDLSDVAAMRKLAAIDVNSRFLGVLLARKIDQMQAQLFMDGDYGYYYKESSPEEHATLSILIKQQLQQPQLKNKEIYYLLQSLIGITKNNLQGARQQLAAIPSNSGYYVDAQRMDFIVRTRMIDAVEPGKINEVFKELEKLRILNSNPAVAAAFFNQIASIYKKSGDAIGGALVAVNYGYYSDEVPYSYAKMKSERRYNYSFDDTYPLLEEGIIKNFQSNFLGSGKLTFFETVILDRLKVSPADFSHDLMGNYYMTMGRLDAALKEYKQVKNTSDFWEDKVRPEIVSSSIKEWMDVDFGSISDEKHLEYPDLVGQPFKADYLENYRDDKIKLVQLMKNLEKRRSQNSKNAADYNYMLGNIWYNISAEGWFVNDLYYVGNDQRNPLKGYNWDDKPMDATYQQVIDRAGDYFEKAVLSNGSQETKAKATFALAKVNRCFNQEYDRNTGNSNLELCDDHVKYFDQLSANYSETQYYQEVLRECSWFVAR